MSRSRERLFKMLTAFSFDEIDSEFVDHELFQRIEAVLKKLAANENGVKRKSERKFLGTVHQNTFTGAEFLHSLQRILDISDIAEAINLANILLHYGYIFLADGHSFSSSIKEDGTLYRFQRPNYWPSQKPDGSEEEYAVYLAKKQLATKSKNGLQQNEMAYFAKLLELFGPRWSDVMETASEQYRALKEKKKAERVVLEKEEEAFWRVHRPMDDMTDAFDVGHKRFLNRCSKKDLRTLSLLQTEVNALRERTTTPRIPSSIAINNLLSHCEQYDGVDVLLNPKGETSSASCWLKDFVPRTLSLNLLRLEKWAISLRELLSDRKGIEEFEAFLKKEFSEENLRFWLDCEDLRYAPKSKVPSTVIRIYRDFMARGARFEVNVDNKAMTTITEGIRTPSRYAFDLAQNQIFNLMNTDSYPRFLKSQQYKDLVERAKSEKVSSARKSNNRLLNAARGFVNRPSLTDIFSNNQKEHRKLGRSSSDFQPSITVSRPCDAQLSTSFGQSCWYLQPKPTLDRSCSESDLTKLDERSNPASPIPHRACLNALKLKGLPVLKLSRSVTPSASPGASPSHSGPSSRKQSPHGSPGPGRKKFGSLKDSDKKSSPLCVNDLNEKLNAVKKNRDIEETEDLNDWHWEKVSHDFF